MQRNQPLPARAGGPRGKKPRYTWLPRCELSSTCPGSHRHRPPPATKNLLPQASSSSPLAPSPSHPSLLPQPRNLSQSVYNYHSSFKRFRRYNYQQAVDCDRYRSLSRHRISCRIGRLRKGGEGRGDFTTSRYTVSPPLPQPPPPPHTHTHTHIHARTHTPTHT